MRHSSWFTEEIWQTCDDSDILRRGLSSLVADGHPKITDRKVYLYQIACAKRVFHLFPEGVCRRTVELAEGIADAPGGPLSRTPLEIIDELRSESDFFGPAPDYLPRPRQSPVEEAALSVALGLAEPESPYRIRDAGVSALSVVKLAARKYRAPHESRAQAELLRDIFGNPFRPVKFREHWKTVDVTALARTIYETQAFDNLPILQDALIDAGCDDKRILDHCRSGWPHVRGCWLIDTILGKE